MWVVQKQGPLIIVKAGNIVSLDVDALALAPDGFSPAPVDVLDRKCGRKLIEGLLHGTLPNRVAAGDKNKRGVTRIFPDPVLRCPRRYP